MTYLLMLLAGIFMVFDDSTNVTNFLLFLIVMLLIGVISALSQRGIYD